MSFTIIAGPAYTSTSDDTTIPVEYPSGVQAGDLLVLVAGNRADLQTQTTPSGWDLRATAVSSGTGPRVQVYTRTGAAGDTGTVNVAITAATPCVGRMFIVRGGDFRTPVVDVVSTDANSAATSITLTQATATAAGQLLVAIASAFYSNTTLRTWTPPGGMDEQCDITSVISGGTNINLFVGTEVLAASGATGTRQITGSANTTSRVGLLLILREREILAGAGDGVASGGGTAQQTLALAGAATAEASGGAGLQQTLAIAGAGEGTSSAGADLTLGAIPATPLAGTGDGAASGGASLAQALAVLGAGMGQSLAGASPSSAQGQAGTGAGGAAGGAALEQRSSLGGSILGLSAGASAILLAQALRGGGLGVGSGGGALGASAAAVSLSYLVTGTITFGTADVTRTVTLATPIADLSRAVLFPPTINGATTSPTSSLVAASITNSTTLTFSRPTSGSTALVLSYTLAVFATGVTVQRGTLTSTNSSATLGTTVDTARAFPLVTLASSSGDNTFSSDDFVAVDLTSTTLTVSAPSTDTGVTIPWQVVELVDASVQVVSATIASGTTSTTATLSSVNTARTFVILTASTADGTNTDIGQKLLTAYLTNSTTLTLARASSGQSMTVRAYVVSSPSISVQRGETTFNGTQTTVAITAVPVERSFPQITGLYGRLGRAAYSTNDSLIAGAVEATLTSGTVLQLDKSNLLGNINPTFPWEVITFSPGETSVTPLAGSIFGLARGGANLTLVPDALVGSLLGAARGTSSGGAFFGRVWTPTTPAEVTSTISSAADGDIIELARNTTYTFTGSVNVTKRLWFRAASGAGALPIMRSPGVNFLVVIDSGGGGTIFDEISFRDAASVGIRQLVDGLTVRNCTFQGINESGTGYCIDCRDAGDLLVEDCTFTAYGTMAVRCKMWLANPSDQLNVTIRRCSATGSTNGGKGEAFLIEGDGTVARYRNILIEDCTSTDTMGPYLRHVSYATIRRCTHTGYYVGTSAGEDDGIALQSVEYAWVYENVASGTVRKAGRSLGGAGIHLYGRDDGNNITSRYVYIYRNTVFNNSFAGIMLSGENQDSNVITQNYSYGTQDAAFRYNPSFTNITISFNTFVDVGGPAILGGLHSDITDPYTTFNVPGYCLFYGNYFRGNLSFEPGGRFEDNAYFGYNSATSTIIAGSNHVRKVFPTAAPNANGSLPANSECRDAVAERALSTYETVDRNGLILVAPYEIGAFQLDSGEAIAIPLEGGGLGRAWAGAALVQRLTLASGALGVAAGEGAISQALALLAAGAGGSTSGGDALASLGLVAGSAGAATGAGAILQALALLAQAEGAASGGVALGQETGVAGGASGGSAGEAALGQGLALLGETGGAATGAGALAMAQQLQAETGGTASGEATLQLALALLAAAAGAGDGGALIALELLLAGEGAGSSTGGLGNTPLVILAGEGAGTSVAGAALALAQRLEGAAAGEAFGEAALGMQLALLAAALGGSDPVAAMAQALALVGAGAGEAQGGAGLGQAQAVQGAGQGEAQGGAGLTGDLPLSGAAAGATTGAEASLGSVQGLTGAAQGDADPLASLALLLALAGQATGESSGGGVVWDLNSLALLVGLAAGSATGAAAVGLALTLTAQARGQAGGGAALRLRARATVGRSRVITVPGNPQQRTIAAPAGRREQQVT